MSWERAGRLESRGPHRPSHRFCCLSTDSSRGRRWGTVGFPVIIAASPADECMGHYGPGGRPWVFPCSFRKRGKASATDVALSLGSCIQSHCTVSAGRMVKVTRPRVCEPPRGSEYNRKLPGIAENVPYAHPRLAFTSFVPDAVCSMGRECLGSNGGCALSPTVAAFHLLI